MSPWESLRGVQFLEGVPRAMRSIPEALNLLTTEVRAANELRAEQNKLLARQVSLLEKQMRLLMSMAEDGVSVAGREGGKENDSGL